MAKAKQAGGRPREQRVDTAIAAAVREVIEASGYAGLTVDAVAARAGVSKAAIYRRYSTKQEMTFAVLLCDLREESPADTGSLHGDLVALTEQIAAQVAGSSPGTLSGLLADIRADPDLRSRFASSFLTVERGIIAAVLDRAIARGELASCPDPALVQALLLGPLYAWLIVLDEDPGRVPELVRVVTTTAAYALTTGVVPA
ncbi:TetR/AcrR family transcriptional regulator [Nocardia asteroides]|uniref:TetR/AcrR family transcriptional regulator n=1 Tax=Nocardia asteroides TaxID=1824 RepID=UPI001E2E2278|nr:TetR/AcrR family transcriptional regulator [Nocardia asteroides]UGT55881.1 TetR/AcrR family transcriptional regulator [Nocardia asteroides]